MQNKHFIIINPTSGKGFALKHKSILLKKLEVLYADFEYAFTSFPKDEIQLVQKAIQLGFRNIISIGGDGTLHHIINGILTQTHVSSDEIQVAVIPLGTGNDWIKQYDISNNIDKAIAVINTNKIVSQDIGALLYNNNTSYFVNSLGIGFDGFVVNSLSKYRKFGNATYFIASLMGLIKYKKSKLRFTYNSKTVTAKTLMLVVGICSFSGGGMRFTHQVDPKDGLFDISILKNISILSFIWHIRKMYNGKLNQHSKVETDKTKRIKIETLKGENPYIQADGELIGRGDFEVKIISNAINFVIS